MEERRQTSLVEGPVFAALIRFAVPVLGALILQAAYGAVDLLVVGQFGDASSISAVGTGSTFMQMITCVIIGLAMGATVTIGQHIGEQKPEEAGNAVGTTVILFAVLGIVLTVLLEVFAGNIVAILQVPEASVAKTISYIRICSGGIMVIIAYNVISSILRGVGNANLPLIFVGIACLVNIIGDLLLVGVFRMDVAGAAIATVVAQFVSVIASLLVLRRQQLPVSFSIKQCKMYSKELKMILNVGVPIACAIGYYAECFCICGTEHWSWRKDKGKTGISDCHDYGMQCGNHYLSRWIFRRIVFLLVFCFPVLVILTDAEKHSGHGAGNHLGILYSYSSLHFCVKASGGIFGAGWSCDTDYYGIWNHILYDLLCVGQT